MQYGMAKVGMRVRIIGNHNNHGFDLGEIVKLNSIFSVPTNLGWGFIANSTDAKRQNAWIVREVDFMPIGGKVV